MHGCMRCASGIVSRGICVRHPLEVQTDSGTGSRGACGLTHSPLGSSALCSPPTLPHTGACRQAAPPAGCPQCGNPTVIIKQSNNVTYGRRASTAVTAAKWSSE